VRARDHIFVCVVVGVIFVRDACPRCLSVRADPFHKFGTGNNQTLVDAPSANGVDIRDELLKFHQAYYSANLMKLCVLGREPLDELEAMVKDLFSAIPNTDAPQPSFSGTPYGPEQLGHTVRVVPIKELYASHAAPAPRFLHDSCVATLVSLTAGVNRRTLQMSWPLPPQDSNYETKPTRYLAHLLGHESAGSVLSVLKKDGLADGLSAGEGSAASDFSSFTVSIELTEEGLERVNEVASVVFQYIGMLQREGVSERVWVEEQAVAKMGFQFKEKEEPASATSRFAGWMHKYPPAETFTGPYLFTKFDRDLIQSMQDGLTVQACMITISAKELEGETDSTEKW
jgi:insulysin